MSRIKFDDILTTLIAWLDGELPPGPAVHVCEKIPKDRPDLMVRLTRTGGARTTRVSESPQVSIDVWAPTITQSHDLAQDVYSILWDAPGNTSQLIYKVAQVGGVAESPDPLSSSPRHVFTLSFHTRGDTS